MRAVSMPRDEAAARSGQLMEHRWGRRIDCGARVRLSASATIGGAGRLRDVSMSGAFIETSVELPPFARIAVSVVRSGPETLREPELLATVARIAHDGVGVEWCETAPRDICPLLGCATPCAAATAFHAPAGR